MPFEPWHLDWLTETTAQAWLGKDIAYGMALKVAGPCFTAFDGAHVVACAGIIPLWNGRAQAWSMLSADIGDYVMPVFRATKRFLDGYPCRRVECTVDPRSERMARWAVRLGFQYEGTMPGYTPQGNTMDLYARVRWP